MCIYRNTFLLLSFLFLVSTVAAGGQGQDSLVAVGDQVPPVNCPVGEAAGAPPDINDFKQVHRGATVLIGADVLGRIAAAVDYDDDGIADDAMLFVATTRLTEPTPTVLQRAKVVVTRSGMMVEAADRSLALAVYLTDDEYQPLRIPRSWRNKYTQVVIEDDGIMFARTDPPPVQQQPLAAYDHNSIYSWPVSFHRDLLAPGTVGGGGCPAGCFGCSCKEPLGIGCNSAGGCGTSSIVGCGSPCSGGGLSCGQNHYACAVCRNLDDVWTCQSTCLECGLVIPAWP